MNFVFFGSAEFSILVLDGLEKRSLLPTLVVTNPDKPKGRKLIMTPNPVKSWAESRNVPVITKIDKESLEAENSVFFLVVAYGKILKKEIFNLPKFKTLNIHPSLLPKYRGASPMISQILNDEAEIGTSIMIIDEGMDTGPVLAQKKIPHLGEVDIFELEKEMARKSVELLSEILPDYLAGKITPKPQNDAEATYCDKIKKEDGLLDLGSDPTGNLLKIRAFARSPRCYYFHNGKRVVVTEAKLDEDGNLELLKVIPEGKIEMLYKDFLRGQK